MKSGANRKNVFVFAVSLTVGALLSYQLRGLRAAEGETDPRVKNLSDASLSGLKAPVPGAVEFDAALKSKEKELVDRELRVKEDEERLRVEEERLKIRVEELTSTQDQIGKIQAENKATSESISKRLIKTFESMSPKKAAAVVTPMTDDLAVELFLNMKEKRVATILEAMDPERASMISSLMASRRPTGMAVGAMAENRQAQPTNRALAVSESEKKKEVKTKK